MMSRGWLIRVATGDDVTAAGRLLAGAYPALMAGAYEEATPRPVLRIMTHANVTLLASSTDYIAEDHGGRMAGRGGWTPERPATGEVLPGLAHIRHFATHPRWTRRGVGRAIHEHCEAAARGANIDAFECCASLNAERFYAALGFRHIRRIELEPGSGVMLPAVLMRRAI